MRPLSGKSLILLLPLLLLTLIFLSYIQFNSDGPWKSHFRPSDLLPLLPFSVSWPLLRSLHSAVDLPTFVGVVSSPETKLEWKDACFFKNTAWMEFHNKSKSLYGGGTLHIMVSNAHSWTCMDLYVFATPYRVTWDYYFLSREHTLEFDEWEGKEEYEHVKHHGVSIYLMQSGMLGTLRAMWYVFPLFTNTGWGENSNLAFLKKHMVAKLKERPKPRLSSINVDDVHSGDFLALSKIRGRWGGFETLKKWVSGAYAGHSAVCLKDSEGKLWGAESGHENDKKCSYPNIIGCLPCSQDNLMGSFFDTHRSLSDPDFSNFLNHEIRSGDLCEGMIDNAEIFGLSSLLRQLMGEGSHRQLVTTVIFCDHPKFTHFVNEHICEAIIIEYLPTGVFSDPFELQHLVRREVFLSASVHGDTNLELPSALSNRSVVEIHIDVKSDIHNVVVQLPLHSRYPPLDSSGYANITIGMPDLFLRCRPKNSKTEACSWTLIDLGFLSESNVTWRIPCGKEVHTRAVTIITFFSAMFCSLLIVLSSIYLSKKNKTKLE